MIEIVTTHGARRMDPTFSLVRWSPTMVVVPRRIRRPGRRPAVSSYLRSRTGAVRRTMRELVQTDRESFVEQTVTGSERILVRKQVLSVPLRSGHLAIVRKRPMHGETR